MLESGSLWVTLSIGFGILSSFGVAIAVGVISRIRPNVNGSWPTLETGKRDLRSEICEKLDTFGPLE